MVQWLRMYLAMQGTPVQSLVQENPTGFEATEFLCHNQVLEPKLCNYWGQALEPVSHKYWAHALQLLKPMRLEPVLCNRSTRCNEKLTHHNEEDPPLITARESLHAAMKTQKIKW